MVYIYELEDKEGEEEEQVNSCPPVQPIETRNLLLNFADEHPTSISNSKRMFADMGHLSRDHLGEQEKEQVNLNLGLHLASHPHSVCPAYVASEVGALKRLGRVLIIMVNYPRERNKAEAKRGLLAFLVKQISS